MKRTFNKKLFLWLLAGTIVLGGAIHGVHTLQAKQTAKGLLRLADEAEGKKNLKKAADYLYRYLSFMPADDDALARYGLILDELAVKNPRLRDKALEALDQVLRRKPERADVRLAAAKCALSMNRFADARAHLDYLLKTNAPKDGELYHLLGRCYIGEGKFDMAAKELKEAIKYPPKKIESYLVLAEVTWRKLNQPVEADGIVDKMVQEKSSGLAHLARASYKRARAAAGVSSNLQEKLLQDGREDIKKAREMAPDDAEVILGIAEWWLGEREPGGARHNTRLLETARTELERGLKLHPGKAPMYLSLCRLETTAGRMEQAIDCLRQGLKQVTDQDRLELRFILADLLIDQGLLGEADEIITAVRREIGKSPPLDFLEASVQVKQQKWLMASKTLESIRLALTKQWPRLSHRADLLLGQCYAQLGDTDQQYAAFKRVVVAEPLSIPGSAGLSQALIALGRVPEAIEVYERFVPRAHHLKLKIAQLLVEHNLGLPAMKQNWSEVDALLQEMKKAYRDSPPMLAEIYVVEASAASAQGNFELAQGLLENAMKAQPDKIEPWITLAFLASREPKGGMEKTLTKLEEAKGKFGDRPELRLAFAWYWLRHGGPEAKQAIARLTENLPVDKQAQRTLWHGFAKIYKSLADPARTKQCLVELDKLEPSNLVTKLNLFDSAVETGDTDAMGKLIKAMREIEGNKGKRWRYAEVIRQIWEAQKRDDKKGLPEAKALLDKLAEEQPGWHRVPTCQGYLQELLGNREAAVKHYLNAIDLGERNQAVIDRIISLLGRMKRQADIAKLYDKLPDPLTVHGNLKYVAMDMALRKQDYTRALALAKKAVEDDPKDYRNYLWLAQVYMRMQETEQQAQAEPALRQAVALASDAPETWVALVKYLVIAKHKDMAESEILNAEKKLPPKERPLALAQCYEALGNLEKAKTWYQAALAAQPEDLAALQSLAKVCFALGQVQETENCLRRIISLKDKYPEEAAEARTSLAVVLSFGGKSHQQLREAYKDLGMLLDSAQAINPVEETFEQLKKQTTEQLRAKATAMALLRQRPYRLAAKGILEHIINERQPTANDQFLLGQLYDSLGEWPKAIAHLSAAVRNDDKNFLYLTQYARSLLRHGEANAVPTLLDKLKKLYPTAAATAEIEARLYHAQGNGKKAAKVLMEYAENNKDALLGVAILLDELQQTEDAEKMLGQFISKSKAPESRLLLAQFLGKHGRLKEAFDECEKAAQNCRPEALAATTLTILYETENTKAHYGACCELVAKWLTTAMQKERTPVLLNYLGALYNLQGNFSESEATYRSVLQLKPNDVTALNNLAWLLAFQPQKNAEALAKIKQAIDVAGPQAGLLDTLGVIHVAGGRAQDALAILKAVVAEDPSASHYFHLAQAYYLAKNSTTALTALNEADRLDPTQKSLHPLDRAARIRLLKLL
jgi:tetratricopeptide (TPR) repeat protein